MKKNYLFVFLLVLIPFVLSAVTLTPSTFTVANLNSITNGTTVYLESGTYTLTQEVLDAWESSVSGKNNITFTPLGSGSVIMDGMSFSEQKRVRFTGCDNLRIEKITLKNIKLQLWQCTNSTFDQITSREQKFILPSGKTELDYGKQQSLLAIGYGDNCTISNCNLEITFPDFSCKVIKSYRGTNHKFINNTITGNLQSGYEIWSNVGQVTNGIEGFSGALVQGGYIERTIQTGSEDHGIYFHDVSDALIDNVTIKGWSPTGAGGAVKIKNSNNVEVKNCTFYTSGVLLRTGSSGWQHCRNIYIHNNDIHGGLALSTYMTPNAGYDNPEAIVFEHNKLFDDGIKMKYDASMFNQYCDRAGKAGGIYNNEYNGTLDVTSGVNGISTNCTWGDGCAMGAGGSGCTPSAITPFLQVNEGSMEQIQHVSLNVGDNITFSPQPATENYTWTGPDGWASTVRETGIINIQANQAGEYIATYTNECGAQSTITYTLSINSGGGSTAYTETFENMTLSGWGSETYTGDNGFVWTVEAKGGSGFVNSSKSIYFHADEVGVISDPIQGGISSFSVECKDLWSSGNERTLELLINESVVGEINHTGSEVYTFSVNNINISGEFTIEINNASSTSANNTIALDNISWTPYQFKSSGADDEAIDVKVNNQKETVTYPNPFSTSFSIELNGGEYKQAKLIDISGKILIIKSLDDTEIVEFSPSYTDVPAGMYFIQLVSDKAVKTIKIMRK